MHFSFFVSLLLVAVSEVSAAYDPDAKTNVAVYWGQNSANDVAAQQPLAHYCESTAVDIVIIAFIIQLDTGNGKPWLDFANQGNDCQIDGKFLTCPNIGGDIKTCQGKGKTVLLSMGGSAGSNVAHFASNDAATTNAATIWKMFGPPPKTEDENIPRPFGDAVIDGFDLDVEHLPAEDLPHIVAWAKAMRTLLNADKNKKYFLTVTPECPAPDTNELVNLLTATTYDMFFVMFYNNGCGPFNTTYTFNDWNKWVKDQKQDTKVFMGLAAQPDAATAGGFFPPTQLEEVMARTTGDSLGGIMLWDASQAWKVGLGKDYHVSAKSVLSKVAPTPTPSG